MKKRFLIIGVLLQLFFAFPSVGQRSNYYQKMFTIQDGLPNNDVKWITQDQSGFLWIGTWDGLARYDGSEFKVYRHDPNDSTSLGYFEVSMICVDSSNNVWTYSANKLCRYVRTHDYFVTYDKYDFPESFLSDSPPVFRIIFIDPEGQLYVSLGDGLYKYDQIEDKFREIFIKDTVVDLEEIDYVSFDNEGKLWIFNFVPGKEYGLVYQCSINGDDGFTIKHTYPLIQHYFQKILPNVTPHIRVFRNSTGNTWMATSHGLYRLAEDTIRVFEGSIGAGEFSGQEIVLWAQSGKGLMAYFPDEVKQDTIFKRNEIDNVVAYYSDKQHNIWFTNSNFISKNGGLGLTYRTGNYFKQYLNETNEVIPSIIYGLIKDESGNIWAGGRPNDYIVKITPEGEIIKIKVLIDSLNIFNYPRDMTMDLEGNIWIGFYYDFLYKFNPKNNEFTNYSNKGILGQYPHHNPRFRLVKSLNNGRLIVGGGGRIYILDKENYKGTFKDTPRLTDLYSVYEDLHGYLWIGLNGQMIKSDLDLLKQEIIVITDNNYNIEDICPGDSTDLWLALLGGGIGHFFPENRRTIFFSTMNGLAHNTVYSIKKDRSGNLWGSHDMGISMLNPQTKNIVNFNEKDGLHIREYDSEAAFQTEEGEMLFGGIGGIVTFFPDSVKMNRLETPTSLLISEFRISNKMVDFDLPVSELKSVKLPKGTDNFQLVLIKPDLRYGDEIRYRYRLEGTVDEWIETDSRHRRINYTSLSPGDYEFWAEATDLNGEWRYQTCLMIEILPYYYQTFYFKVLMVLLCLGFLAIFLIMKLKQSRLKELRKYEQLRLETLHSQMNPHFISNSLNSINYFISLNDRLNANQYLTDFYRLMRAILSNSAQDYISLETEIQAIKDYISLEHLRFSNKFDFEIFIDENVDQVNSEVIPALIQPFIENAIGHGLRYLENRKGFLSVRIVKEGQSSLVCYIKDDGIGRKLSVKRKTDEQKKRRSRGIAIAEERLEIINSLQKTKYTIIVSNLYDDREETGTKVRIELPIKKSAAKYY